MCIVCIFTFSSTFCDYCDFFFHFFLNYHLMCTLLHFILYVHLRTSTYICKFNTILCEIDYANSTNYTQKSHLYINLYLWYSLNRNHNEFIFKRCIKRKRLMHCLLYFLKQNNNRMGTHIYKIIIVWTR